MCVVSCHIYSQPIWKDGQPAEPSHPQSSPSFQELRELPVVGGTRLVLSPGGAISMVLTSAEFVTVSVTGIAISTTEAELRARFAEFGQVLRVGLHHVVIAEGSSDRSARPLSGHASAGGPGQQKASSWARVTFREPAFAEAAVLAQERLGPWKLKGARPAPMDHTFVQVSRG